MFVSIRNIPGSACTSALQYGFIQNTEPCHSTTQQLPIAVMTPVAATSHKTTTNRKRPPQGSGVEPNAKQPKLTIKEQQPKKWSTLEDDLVCTYVSSVGGKENVRWAKCAQFLQDQAQVNRSAHGCRHRYNTYLANTSTVTIGSKASKKTRHCGIQTDVSFPASDNVAWASEGQQEEAGSCNLTSPTQTSVLQLTPSPSLRSLLVSSLSECKLPLPLTPQRTTSGTSRQLFKQVHTTPTTCSTPNSSYTTPGGPALTTRTPSPKSPEPEVAIQQSEMSPPCAPLITPPTTASGLSETSSASDHNYRKKKAPASRRKKHKIKVTPKVAMLTSRLLTSDKGSFTLRERARVNLCLKDMKSPTNVARSIMSIPPVRSAVVKCLSEELGERPKAMRNHKHGQVSILMKKDFESMQNSCLANVVSEFHGKFPELFQLVVGIMGTKENDSVGLQRLIPRLAMVYSIILQTRCPSLSLVQRVMTMSMADQICNQKVYDRLNTLGVTLSYPSLLNITKEVGARVRDQLVSAVKAGKRLRLIGDNLDFEQGVSYETIDRHKHLVHMFASCALVTEPVFTEKPDQPQIPLRNLCVDDVTFSTEEYEVMREDLVIMAAKLIGKYLPQLKFFLDTLPKECVPRHPEFKHKTEVIPLPVLKAHEQYEQDTIKILDYYEELVRDLPFETSEPIQIGGDQLTRERFGSALKLRIGNLHNRFALLGPCTFEFFHLGMNYLEKIVFEQLWTSGVEDEIGTLRGERERIIRKSVDSNVHKAYDADKTFFLNYVTAHIIEAAQDFYGLEHRNDYPTKNKPPTEATPAEMKQWARQSVGALIDQYCFPHWTKHDKPVYISQETTTERLVTVKLTNGTTTKVKKRKKTVTVKTAAPDKKKIHAHYVLEAGMTYMYFLQLCKTPDRQRLLGVFKLMMEQLKGRSTHAKYPYELLMMLFHQYSLLPEKRAHQVLHACFVNTKGHPDSNVPADLQMEWVVKQNKQHIKHMFSNKNMSNILTKSSALPGMHSIASNLDTDAQVVVRSKTNKPKDLDRDEMIMMDDLRMIRPFEFQPGRAYNHPHLANLPISQGKVLDTDKVRSWFDKHKKKLL